MRINNNITAQFAHRILTNHNNALSTHITRLSSGLRINKAADDAAGLAISERLRTRINGWNQAEKNIQDGISLFQTAEGGLEEIHAMLQRMRVLAVQSANDTLTSSDRNLLQAEFTQLVCEVDRLMTTVEFNGKKLLVPNSTTIAGTEGTEGTAGTPASWKSTGTVTPPGPFGGDISSFDLAAAGLSSTSKIKIEIGFNGGEMLLIDAITDSATGTVTGTYINGTATTGAANFQSPNSLNGNPDGGRGGVFGGNTALASAEYSLSSTVTNGAGNDIVLKSVAVGAAGGIPVTVYAYDPGTPGTPAVPGTEDTVTGDPIEDLHVGPESGQTLAVDLPDLSDDALGIDNLSISTRGGAESAIYALDTAITSVSGARASIGAKTNRLEHTMNFAGIAAENEQTAESRIRDADMATEMMAYTKTQILTQAAQAMLGQANLLPQMVLQLFQ